MPMMLMCIISLISSIFFGLSTLKLLQNGTKQISQPIPPINQSIIAPSDSKKVLLIIIDGLNYPNFKIGPIQELFKTYAEDSKTYMIQSQVFYY
jgi:predicted AlkP superfamily pyrophosphatase or phosphodiesterase